MDVFPTELQGMIMACDHCEIIDDNARVSRAPPASPAPPTRKRLSYSNKGDRWSEQTLVKRIDSLQKPCRRGSLINIMSEESPRPDQPRMPIRQRSLTLRREADVERMRPKLSTARLLSVVLSAMDFSDEEQTS